MTNDRSTPALEARDLGHSYGDHEVLRGLNFTIAQGELMCIVGPSGAGKTTLLNCLTGLRRPSAGAVLFENQPIVGTPRGMAVVFQDYSRSLMPWLRVEDNVMLPLRSAGIPKDQRRQQAAEALAEVGLSDAGRKYPWQLSGGMQQRVAIARALAFRPRLVVMDEPFASVDAQTRADLEDLTLRVRDHLGITFLVVTHDIDEAVYLSDRVLALGGKPSTIKAIVRTGLPRERDQLTTKRTKQFAEVRSEIYQLIRGASVTEPR
ncbi:ABC transporter ATP-binding protein [Granulicoccus sp. GXG6511]|uniref:ABC transporter ATP-binding protein n=1 Tax=Granulicoccus sp. GXG6511 TaxID=3381351 RepID=UPI003D7F0B15